MSSLKVATIFLHLIIFILFSSSPIICWPSGAPDTACNSLSPGHGANRPQDPSSSPFLITQSSIAYQPGEPIQVIVKGQPGLPFRGLMVQAYDPETGQTIGNFQQGRGLKVLEQCSAVTHMDRRGKRSATLLWDPPGQGGGRVGFRGTVVKRYSEYYEGIDAIPES